MRPPAGHFRIPVAWGSENYRDGDAWPVRPGEEPIGRIAQITRSLIGNLLGPLTWGRSRVVGDSMLPALADGQYVLLWRGPSLRDRLRRGDIVVLRHPVLRHQTYIKRVVGLPNEDLRLEDGRVYVGGVRLEETYLRCPGPAGQAGEWWMGPDEYFVMGDNRLNSHDSRYFGPVAAAQIVGRVWLRYWPRRAWGLVAGAFGSRR